MPEIQDNNGLTFRTGSPNLTAVPSDTIPPVDRGDVTGLDEDHLRKYILSAFKNMIADKQDYGWVQKKDYAMRSYYGLKDEAMKHWPWEGASAFPVPLTPTILDTAWANVQSGIWSNPGGPVRVPGIQGEDIRPAKILESFMNWQTVNDMPLEEESDKNVFRTFLLGTGIFKVMYDLRSQSVKVYSIDTENFFVPVDASSVQKDGTDITIHVIPLSYNDIQLRKGMGIYRNADEIVPGIGINISDNEITRRTMDEVSGVSLDSKIRRETYYVAEVDLIPYIPPNSTRPMDLKVWISPNGGKIQRIRPNKSGKTPYAAAHCYPYANRFYSMGIPEKIQNIQEKIDYADKQNTDAMDRAISPAAFADDTDSFDRTRAQRVPGGIYPKGKGITIDWEPQPAMERGFERQIPYLWEQAERLTGVIDVMQGRSSFSGSKTLGEVEIRAARTDVRFSAIFKRFGKQWKEILTLTHELNYEYMPESKIMDVIGYSAEGYTFNELYPIRNGKLCNYNFGFSGELQSNREEENQKKADFYSQQILLPHVSQDIASLWRVSNEWAQARGVRDYENVVPKPKEANLIAVHEFIQRAVSGQRDLQIRPGIDTDDYIFELQLFMKTETFQNLQPYQQKILQDALRISTVMSAAERRAMLDLMLTQESAKFNAIQEQNALSQQPQEQPAVA